MSSSEKQSSRVDLLVREDGFFPGYHIRRGNLVSILLEGSVSLDEICSWIDKSYQVTASAKTKHDTSGWIWRMGFPLSRTMIGKAYWPKTTMGTKKKTHICSTQQKESAGSIKPADSFYISLSDAVGSQKPMLPSE